MMMLKTLVLATSIAVLDASWDWARPEQVAQPAQRAQQNWQQEGLPEPDVDAGYNGHDPMNGNIDARNVMQNSCQKFSVLDLIQEYVKGEKYLSNTHLDHAKDLALKTFPQTHWQILARWWLERAAIKGRTNYFVVKRTENSKKRFVNWARKLNRAWTSTNILFVQYFEDNGAKRIRWIRYGEFKKVIEFWKNDKTGTPEPRWNKPNGISMDDFIPDVDGGYDECQTIRFSTPGSLTKKHHKKWTFYEIKTGHGGLEPSSKMKKQFVTTTGFEIKENTAKGKPTTGN